MPGEQKCDTNSMSEVQVAPSTTMASGCPAGSRRTPPRVCVGAAGAAAAASDAARSYCTLTVAKSLPL